MKKAIALLILLLVSSMNMTQSEQPIKILIDESRIDSMDELIQWLFPSEEFPDPPDWRNSFENYDYEWGFGRAAEALQKIASVTIRKSGKISYSTLKDYDILIIASFKEDYGTAEVDAIMEFVENGGGLLMLGDYRSPNNCISRPFDVLFYSKEAIIADKKAENFSTTIRSEVRLGGLLHSDLLITDIGNHSVMRGVEKIALYIGLPISSYESGTVLAKTSEDSWADTIGKGRMGAKDSEELEGPFSIVLIMERGKGRAVFFGGSWSFFNWVMDEKGHQNLNFLENTVAWLGEPGGPYKQYRTINEEAQESLVHAMSLYSNHKFSQAKSAFEDTIRIFEESSRIYLNADAHKGIEEVTDYLEKCEIGIEADSIFENALQFLDKREYERAIEAFEKCRLMYEKIDHTERIEECSTRIDEAHHSITLQNEASSLFQQAEDVFSAAVSTFDFTGYEKAKSIFEEAKNKWLEYDDPARVEACEERIVQCTGEIAEIKKTRTTVIALIAGVLVLCIGIVMVWRNVAKKGEPVSSRREEAKSVIKTISERYARGEITRKEYEELKSLLEK
ncbi:MAG: hypothetical protein HXS44_13545 [Theionarchaea archaeon]|nr:hypothetical protein [Theionarchaea archaeon]